jgi:hypothetical protein
MENNEIAKIATALNKAQGVISGAKKDKKNDFFKSNFADLSSVFEAIRVPFAENGLSVTQTMDVIEGGKQILCTKLMHISGEFIESKMLLPSDPNPQKLGSAITYFRRYSLMAIAGIPASDDDANSASNKPSPQVSFITPKQVADLERLINGHTEIRKKVLSNCNQKMESITVDRYPGAVQWINDLIAELKND